MICKECGEDAKHHAFGLCSRCYKAKYWNIHKEELKQKNKQYYESNQDKCRERDCRYRRAHGGKPASENKQCAAFLGVHVAEQVLSKVFKDVERMPANHAGHDFICNKGKKIDVKSSCTHTPDNHTDRWVFTIRKNKISDYFLCLAFDNREDLNPLHIWLIPGIILNHLGSASISESTLSRWDKYKLDINKVISCCNTMKQRGEQ